MLHILFHIAFVFSILLLFRINKWLSLIGRRQFFGRTCKRKRKKQQQKTDFNDLTAFSHIYLLNNNKFCLHNNQNIQEYSINHLNNMIMLSCLFFKKSVCNEFRIISSRCSLSGFSNSLCAEKQSLCAWPLRKLWILSLQTNAKDGSTHQTLNINKLRESCLNTVKSRYEFSFPQFKLLAGDK